MSVRNKNDSPQGRQGRRSLQLTIVLLVLAGIVVAATVYHFFPRQEAGDKSPPQAEGPDLARTIRAKMENALAAMDETADCSDRASQMLRREILSELRIKAAGYILSNRGDVTVRPMLAKVLLRLDQADAAERVVDDLLKLAPGSAEGLWLKGVIMRQHQEKGYADLIRRAAESPQADAEIWATYGQVLVDEGRHEQAEIYLAKSLQARRQAGERLTPKDAEMLCSLAGMEIRRGRFDLAIMRLTEAAKLAPADLEVVLRLIEAQRGAGKLDAAELTLEDARNRFHKWADQAALSVELGNIRSRQEKWLEAADAYGQAVGHPKLGADAGLEAAKCCYKAGKYALAMEQIDAALEVRPQHAETLQWARRIEEARFPRPQ
jgi:tetratricopeptide (TPR) repeat protein